jgi:subtilase family serine protease
MQLSPGYLSRRRIPISFVIVALVWSLLPMLGASPFLSGVAAQSGALVVSVGGVHARLAQLGATPPSDASCRAKLGVPCYSPQEMRKAYGMTSVINSGFTGSGQTIIIVDSFGSPTIAHDLHVFDKGFGLPDPPSLRVLAPLGTVAFNPNNSDQVGWAAETTLDVEWAHSLAPGASIVLMTSPVSETEGVQGMPQFLQLEEYAINHHLGNIVSQSWGATENSLFTPAGRDVLNDFNAFYRQATNNGVTFFASSGDSGSANPDVNGHIYPFPTVGFPASSPWVTAVGGTSLFASTSGKYQSETVWNEGPTAGATGGGISQYFKEPDYQRDTLPHSDKALLKGMRGLPDISYDADPNTGVLVYLSFAGVGAPGYYIIGGTSAGSPQWAGIIADANQWAGRPLGFLNPALYRMGASGDASDDFHDITVGNNSQNGIPGYSAMPGWDASTGWGTPRGAETLENLIQSTN